MKQVQVSLYTKSLRGQFAVSHFIQLQASYPTYSIVSLLQSCR